MSKKNPSPWANLLDCVGTAIVAVASVPLIIIDVAVNSAIQ